MEKKQIPIIVIAVFSISILFMFDNIIKPSYALSFYNTTVTENIGVDAHIINGVSVFTSIDFDDGTYKTWRANDGTVLYSGNADNACTDAVLACTYNNVECSGDVCWFHADVAGNDRVVKLIPSTGADSICVATGESSTSGQYLLLSGFLYLAYTNGANEKLRQVNIVSCDVADFVDTADLNVPTPKPVAGATISGVNYVALGGSTLFDIINVNTMTVKCQSGTVDNYLGGVFHNNLWYIGSDDGLVRAIDNSCVTSSTITASTLGCTGGVTQDIASNGNDLIFIACDIASANNKIIAYNTTANSVLATYACAGNSAWGDQNLDKVSYSSGADAVACSTDDIDLVRTILQQGIQEETPTTGINCDDPSNANILICRLGGDGTLGSAGTFVIGNVTAGTGILGIGCSIGLVDCVTDDNPQTNGLGLLIFIASIFVIVGMFFRTIGAENTFHLPIFVWIVIIIALSAFFTITGLIDPVFLIISVIALIALASPKVVSILNRGTMGGGSTE